MPRQPNVIFILADQLRHDFISGYGADFIETPHIDALAERGVRFSNAYSCHPLCVPARVALLTGMDAVQNGVLDNGQFLRADYAACGLRTWPEALGAAGYHTAAVGKMHFYPWDLRLGFQYRVIAEDKRWIHVRDDYYHHLAAQGLRKYHGNEHAGYFENKGAVINRLPWEHSVDHYVGRQACRFIHEHSGEGPFALMIGFPGPHCPYDPTPEYATFHPDDMPAPVPHVPADSAGLRRRNIEGNRGAWNGVDYSEFTVAQMRKVRAHYAGLVKAIDDEVGAIVQTLRDEGLAENTAIIFSSDHGDNLGDHGLMGKGHFYEASIHVPMLVHLPWAQGGGIVGELVTLTDVTASLYRLAGLEVPAHMDSRPLPGLGAERAPRAGIVGQLGGGWMLYDGRYRYSVYADGEAMLFDRRQDPDEQHNLLREPVHRERALAMGLELNRRIMASLLEAGHDRRVYVRDLSQQPWFGREGWQRPYPRPVADR